MPAKERAICHRLREFRISTRLSQAEFCMLAGLNLRAYASYEYCRSQLNYPAAAQILTTYPVLNPIWLATGEGEMVEGRLFKYPPPEAIGAGKRSLFSALFPLLKSRLSEAPTGHLLRPWHGLALFSVTPDAAGRILCKDRLGDFISARLAEQTDEGVEPFMNRLLSRIAKIAAHSPKDPDKAAIAKRLEEMREIEERRRFGQAGANSQKKDLTETASHAKTAFVKSQLKDLLAALKRLTDEPGKKTELAKFLGVSLESVSRWLSGKREPGGEITLRLLRWVEQRERS